MATITAVRTEAKRVRLATKSLNFGSSWILAIDSGFMTSSPGRTLEFFTSQVRTIQQNLHAVKRPSSACPQHSDGGKVARVPAASDGDWHEAADHHCRG